MSYSQSSVWDRPKTYKDMLIPYFRCANGIESKCVRPKEYHWEQWTLQCAFTLSRVGINTKFDWRWTENLKIAENYGRGICMGAYMSEGCQKSVSSPKTIMAAVGFEPGSSHMQSEEVTTRPAAKLSTHGRRMFTIFDVKLRICLIEFCQRIVVSNIHCEMKRDDTDQV